MVFSAVFVHFLLVGAVVATLGWCVDTSGIED